MDPRQAATVTVFAGLMSPQLAHVYAALPSGSSETIRLGGTVRGPLSAETHTLPATCHLEFLGHQPQPLARAVIPDPCFWRPGQPYYYEVVVAEVSGNGDSILARHMLALRRLGTSGGRLVWDLDPWQLHAAPLPANPLSTDRASGDKTTDLAAWKKAQMAVIANNPGTDVLRACSLAGVPVVIDLAECDDGVWPDQLRQFAQWPAVACAVLPPGPLQSIRPRDPAPNVLLLQSWTGQRSNAADDRIDGLVVKASDWKRYGEIRAETDMPFVRLQAVPGSAPLDKWKQLCVEQEREQPPLQPIAGTLLCAIGDDPIVSV